MTKFPKKITPCPIVEVNFELRFKASIPDDAVFGVLYNQFSDEYPRFDQLPILQVPVQIRDGNPALRYNPHYKATKDSYILQIGPRAISVSCVAPYSGWEDYSREINSTCRRVFDSSIIEKVERLGLRYINVLRDVNVYENANIGITLIGEGITKKTNLTTEIPHPHGSSRVVISSDSEVHNQGETSLGSVIDIDTWFTHEGSMSKFEEALEQAHSIEKELFFKILKEEYINTLNPEY